MRIGGSEENGTEKFIYGNVFPGAKRCPASTAEGWRRAPQYERHLRTRLSGVPSLSFRQATSTPSWDEHELIDPEVHAWTVASLALSRDSSMSRLRDEDDFSKTRLMRLLYYA